MYHRNPLLIQFLYDVGYVERLGRGVRNSIETMRKYNGKEIDITSNVYRQLFGNPVIYL